MKFIVMVWAAFLARVKPVSASAKPACMNITRNPATRTQTKFSATRVCPRAAPISSTVGFPAIFDGTLAIPPVLAPDGSAAARSGIAPRISAARAHPRIILLPFLVFISTSRLLISVTGPCC